MPNALEKSENKFKHHTRMFSKESTFYNQALEFQSYHRNCLMISDEFDERAISLRAKLLCGLKVKTNRSILTKRRYMERQRKIGGNLISVEV